MPEPLRNVPEGLSLGSRASLHDGSSFPYLGLGVYRSPLGRPTQAAVGYALEIGYRHIDTARIYGNERDVGIAVRESGVPRDTIFVTTKLWNTDHGYDAAVKACERSLRETRPRPLDRREQLHD